MQILTGHNSPETAHVVADYPYGFRLRCQIRYWIETTKHGQRFVSQTSNPKREGLVWNKPKASTYSDVRVMFLDENNHVQTDGLSLAYADEEKYNSFLARFGEAMQDEYGQKFCKHARAIFATRKHVKVECHIGGERQTPEEQKAVMASLAAIYRANLAEDAA